ncbi:DUF2207 domain-containing protein [Thalassospira alkalitolerans]|uniref:DUF2207 domain-containing protein n=1 Tax=Thalassospira alkalitolerans TaxID=1293890 RepID=UPI003AA9894E
MAMLHRLAGFMMGLIVILVLGNHGAVAQSNSERNERIISFAAYITVLENGDIRVIEKIKVNATGDKIKRGIYRDIPVISLSQFGLYDVSGFDIEYLLRDDKGEPFFTKTFGPGIRIYIGDPDHFITKGVHAYEIAYVMSGQLGHGNGLDELYWNVTGNGWDLGIDEATVRIEVPTGATIGQFSAYTGAKGQTESDYKVLANSGGELWLATTGRLLPREGLTIAVSWPEGFVQHPGLTEQLFKLATDNRGLLAGVFGVMILLVYFGAAWHQVGRDPRAETVIPRFEPPKGMSPAMVGFLWGKGNGGESFVTNAFAVILTSLATKRIVTIRVTPLKEYQIGKVQGDRSDLPEEEIDMYNTLLGSSKAPEITIGDGYLPQVRTARDGIARHFNTDLQNAYIIRNGREWKTGCVIGLMAIIAILVLDPSVGMVDLESALVAGFCGVFAFGAGMILFNIFRRLLANFGVRRGGKLPDAVKLVIVSTVVAAPVLGVMGVLVNTISPLAIFTIILIIIICGTFSIWLEAPTKEFQQLLGHIAGYRRYLTVAEEDRLNFAGEESEITAALFEKHLPYAMALGVEDVWTDKFEASLRKQAANVGPDGDADLDGVSRYNPTWYRDTRGDWRGLRSFSAQSVGRFSSAAVSFGAPAPAPAKSIGFSSSGGGFSGGGRGGGGGGGW